MKKYCVLPFISVRIEDNKNQNSMGIRPCCFYRGNDLPVFKSVDEYLKSDFLAELQQHLLSQDELPSGCETCRYVEAKKLQSVRQLKNKFFHNIILQETNVKELDIFPSNTCNLSCVMCSPKFSSKVAAEQKKLGWINEIYNFDETDLILETIQSQPNLEYIHIAGGEFFYSKHCIKILEAIQKAQIPNVEFITNGTICDDRHIEILKTFKNLSMRFSFDGTDHFYDFIRYPATWDSVVENINKFKQQLIKAHLETVMTVQPLNIFNILDWTDQANQLGLETHYQIIQGDMGWGAITAEEKKLASEFILSNYKNYQFNSKQLITILNYAKNVLPALPFFQEERDKFLDKTVALVRNRSLDPNAIRQVLGSWTKLQETLTSRLV